MLKTAERGTDLKTLTPATPASVQKWLRCLKDRKNEAGRPLANTKQYEAVAVVAERVMQELRASAEASAPVGEPLRWCLHGGPGTGKSHVIKLVKELCTTVLHWDMGVEFQVVALQAVMAEQLGGDTIHHACGIPVNRRGEGNEEQVQKQQDIAKRVLQWRWLIIDEISKVSAELLATVDVKLRDAIRRIGTEKLDEEDVDRPFGGTPYHDTLAVVSFARDRQ